jgi:hypothetical protein
MQHFIIYPHSRAFVVEIEDIQIPDSYNTSRVLEIT